jgi:hypothetical protein
VEHPLDQLSKRVGIEWLPQDRNWRTAGEDIQAVQWLFRSHEDNARCHVRPRVGDLLVQSLTIHLGHVSVGQDDGKAAFGKQRDGFASIPGRFGPVPERDQEIDKHVADIRLIFDD